MEPPWKEIPVKEPKRPEVEALIRAEVDRAVAPYEGVAPPFVVAKLRETSELYWREHPQASRALELLLAKQRIISGEQSLGGAEGVRVLAAAAGGKKGKV